MNWGSLKANISYVSSNASFDNVFLQYGGMQYSTVTLMHRDINRYLFSLSLATRNTLIAEIDNLLVRPTEVIKQYAGEQHRNAYVLRCIKVCY